MRAPIRSTVPPEATETISYGMPAFKHKGVAGVVRRVFEPLQFVPYCVRDRRRSRSELQGFSTSKGTIHFPTDKPLPTALVKKLVKARVATERKQETALTGLPRDLFMTSKTADGSRDHRNGLIAW